MSHYEHESDSDHGSECSPEQMLWLAVIEQTVWDAKELKRKLGDTRRAPWILRERLDLLQDISLPWFTEVCQNAGIDTSSVISRINAILTFKS